MSGVRLLADALCSGSCNDQHRRNKLCAMIRRAGQGPCSARQQLSNAEAGTLPRLWRVAVRFPLGSGVCYTTCMAESHKDNLSLTATHGKEVPATLQTIVPELAEAIRQEKGQLDVNILLRVVEATAADPEAAITYAREILAVAEQYEQQRLRAWQQRAEAVIALKDTDPDEREKRHNNEIRRSLKMAVATCAALSTLGTMACVVLEAGIVATGVLGLIAAISLAMTGSLAAGESVSSNDAARVLEALEGLFNTEREEKDAKSTQHQ